MRLVVVVLAVLLACPLLCGAEHSEAAVARVAYLESLTFPDESALHKAYFRVESLPAVPPRFASLTAAAFAELAREGRPFIVRGTSLSSTEWSCDKLREVFPEEEVNPQPYDTDLVFNRSARRFSSLFDSGFDASIRPVTPVIDPLDPIVVSWFTPFHISAANLTARALVSDSLKLPDFFSPASTLNTRALTARVEFFMGAKNSGLQPHSDPQCHWIMSSQMSGEKNWRLAPPFNAKLFLELNPSYGTHIVPSDMILLQGIQMKRHPLYDVNLAAGDLLFFPPGMLHATRVASTQCSLSLSIAFFSPAPIDYLRHFGENLAADQMTGRCFAEMWNLWLFGETIPSWNEFGNSYFAEKHFAELDSDGSGVLTRSEILSYFRRRTLLPFENAASPLRESNGSEIVTEAVQNLAADNFVAIHDANGDGIVSKFEFEFQIYALWRGDFLKSVLRSLYFTPLDADGDGLLTQEEISHLFPEFNLSAVPELPEVIGVDSYDAHVAELHELFMQSESQENNVVSANVSQEKQNGTYAIECANSTSVESVPPEYQMSFDFFSENSHFFRLEDSGLIISPGEKRIAKFSENGTQLSCAAQLIQSDIFDTDPNGKSCPAMFDISIFKNILFFLPRNIGEKNVGFVLFGDEEDERGERLFVGRFSASGAREGEGILVHLFSRKITLQNWQIGEDKIPIFALAHN